jgi:hypothetical protein
VWQSFAQTNLRHRRQDESDTRGGTQESRKKSARHLSTAISQDIDRCFVQI